MSFGGGGGQRGEKRREKIGIGGAVGLVRVPAHGKTTARDMNDSLCLLTRLAHKGISCSLVMVIVVIFGIFEGKRKQEAMGGLVCDTSVSK